MAAYMGSKRRVAKKILPIILKDRTPNQLYCEPFLGGANTMIRVDGRRLAGDTHYYLIEMWKALQKGWIPPTKISKEEWKRIKGNKDDYKPCLVGFVGFMSSFGTIWFSSYAKTPKGRRFHTTARSERLVKDINLMQNVIFEHCSYEQLDIEENSIIYCDPPYKDTDNGSYRGISKRFDHEKFWNWVRRKSQSNQVFISEFNAPDDFDCLIEIERNSFVNNEKQTPQTERLFKYKYGI